MTCMGEGSSLIRDTPRGGRGEEGVGVVGVSRFSCV